MDSSGLLRVPKRATSMELGGQIVRKMFVLLICVMLNYQMFDICFACVVSVFIFSLLFLLCVRLLLLCVICYVCQFWDIVRV